MPETIATLYLREWDRLLAYMFRYGIPFPFPFPFDAEQEIPLLLFANEQRGRVA